MDVEQPVVELMRGASKESEFFEPSKYNLIKQGKFRYVHSNGEERVIDLKESFIYTTKIGNKVVKKYLHHEDWAYPVIPSSPLREFRSWKDSINHAMSADLKWKAEEKKATAKQLMAIATIIGIIICGVILFVMLKPDDAPQVVRSATEVVKQQVANGSITIVK